MKVSNISGGYGSTGPQELQDVLSYDDETVYLWPGQNAVILQSLAGKVKRPPQAIRDFVLDENRLLGSEK
jgi:hypothetical protein